MRFVSVRNSMRARKSISSSAMGSRTSRSSRVKSSDMLPSRVTRRLLNSICARWSIKVWRRLGCLISSARSSSSSRLPYSLISKAAVLMPMPGAPGTLSTLSPASACTSTTPSGKTPNFSNTPSRSMRFCFIASYISTPSPTSCIMSLSDEIIVHRPPASRAWRARVAIMSSASKPSISSQAMLKALVASRVSGICGRKSSGIASRLALYWSYMSLRKVWLPLSKITATWVTSLPAFPST